MSHQIDLTGKKFGKLTVLSYENDKHKWKCLCDCGNISFVKSAHLRKGLVLSCGCYNREKTSLSVTKDLTGKKFGKLTVIKREGSIKGRASWLCHCDCGNDIVLQSTNLLNYGTKSCGCLRKQTARITRSQNLTGKIFGDLLVIKRDISTNKWLCKCNKCGNMVLVKTSSLNNGRKNNCGCVDKFSITSRKKSYHKLQKWNEYVIPLFTQEEYIYCNDFNNHIWKWKCIKCGDEFQSSIHTTRFNKQFDNLPRCLKCYPYISGFSYIEKEMVDFIKSIYQGEIIENDRTTISPYELDIYLQEKKIAFQFDGLYWHSKYDKNYHLNKTELCEKQGIHLIHIFEDEWINKQEIVKDRIKSVLGIDRTRVYARNCEIKEISSFISNDFLDNNHLQGRDNSKYRYGLFYENELLAVMTFGAPRFNKNYDYELIRFASKIGYQVIGGASKLLDNFRKQNKGSIISYADRRYSNGKLYEALGFKLTNQSIPNYFYVRGNMKLSRYQCQKHKLKKLLDNNFNENLSENENMLKNGYGIIYDCGNLIYLLK